MPYVTPAFRLAAYNCPHCDAYSHITWNQLYTSGFGFTLTAIFSATCTHCHEATYWISEEVSRGNEPATGRMIEPRAVLAPLPHPDMPADVRADYLEARSIAGDSPRGAAALLRLGIQKLCAGLGGTGRSIDQDIAQMVANGLPEEIQQALDVVRVVGNHAVHPGEISPDDVASVAAALFDLVNQIVEERISRPKRTKALFDKLPKGAKDHIKKRDAPT